MISNNYTFTIIRRRISSGLLFLTLAFILSGDFHASDRPQAAARLGSDQGHPKPQVKVELTLERTTYRLMEPIYATVKVTNKSQADLFLKEWGNESPVFDFEVDDTTDDRLRRVPRTDHFDRYVRHRLVWKVKGDWRLRPGEAQEFRRCVNLDSDMTGSERYQVVAKLPHYPTAYLKPDDEQLARSAPVQVQVRGRTTPVPPARPSPSMIP